MPDRSTSVFAREFKASAPRAFYFLIFTISGFSGLIYESIWSHYLKLFLGHAAYAQSLVLTIFMGGMAIGSWIASRFSTKSRSPLLIYAGVELVVGLAGLMFHGVFTSTVEVIYNSILPSVGSPIAGASLKWFVASILIMPQSVLLGMTFPVMSAGIIRRFPDTRGGSIAMLYFTNSIGAAIGVLASGFWLIELVGLPGTIVTAGLLNVALAITVFILVRLDPASATAPIQSVPDANRDTFLKLVFLAAAFITGAASFMYEIGWIRMLSLVLGATTHSFELMLSAFITGLAFGGLWIKKRIDRIGSPIRFSGYVQLIMGVLALLTLPVYAASFGWMEWLITALDKTDPGYTGYHLASHAIALSVMLPATFMAGMTLPLFTFVLLDKGHGEASIGQVYAANTVGAIVGVLAAVHIGLPVLGLKNLIVFAAMLDIGLGLYLLSRSRSRSGRFGELAAAGTFGVAALAVTLSVADIDPRLLISGVYRTGVASLAEDDKVIFYQDGKTSTVSLLVNGAGVVVLSTNGKPDASIQLDPDKPVSDDELTQIIAGAIPIAFMPDVKNVANIGMGSGVTTHVLLGYDGIENVDTIEIESAMVAAARGYGKFVERAYTDPRSKIYIEDAKTFFSLRNSAYDIIIAEPSNPWVSGVASLFSTEFYDTVKRHLVDDGLFVQWIQLYEFNDLLAESILKALTESFSDYVIYTTDGMNILLIARNQGKLPEPDWSAVLESDMKASLARVDVKSEHDLRIRKIVERDSLIPYLKRSVAPVNSDYFPFVDLHAGQARFKSSIALVFGQWMMPPLPVLEMLDGKPLDFDGLTKTKHLPLVIQTSRAEFIFERLMGSSSVVDQNKMERLLNPTMHYLTEFMRNEMNSCSVGKEWSGFVFVLHDLMINSLPYLTPDKGSELVEELAASSCGRQTSDHVGEWLDLYRAVARRDGRAMSARAGYLLADDVETPAIFDEYLVGAAMLGAIASGAGSDALDIWNSTGSTLLADDTLAAHTQLILSIALDTQAPGMQYSRTASR